MRIGIYYSMYLLLAAAIGCGSSADSSSNLPGSSPSRVTGSEDERIEQLEQLADSGEFSSAPQAFDALENESSEVRVAAIKAAEKLVGRGVRIRPYDPPERRREAVDAYRRLHALADQTGVTRVIDTVPALIDQLEDEDEQVRQQAYDDLRRITGWSFPFRADQRASAAADYREMWEMWNSPGDITLELLRDPEKMREYKQRHVDEIKRHKAGA
jgi:hypothetical protein